jgi:sec-independent protein translocase protein TatA
MGNIGWFQLLIVLVIVVLLFGTKKLKTLGGDLGSAIKGFKKAVEDKDQDADFVAQEKVDGKSDTVLQQKEQAQSSEKKEQP